MPYNLSYTISIIQLKPIAVTVALREKTETGDALKGRNVMKQKRLLLILFTVLILFGIFVGTAAAQNVDVSTMSNEELMVLLQSIMQRLEQNTETETEEKGSETVEIPTSAKDTAGSTKQVTKQESKKYSVYKNKKLVIGRMPESWFIRKKPGGGGGDDDSGGSGGTTTFEFHYGDYTFTIDIPEGSYGDYGIPTNVWTAW